MELTEPGCGSARVHRGFRVEKPDRVFQGARSNQGVFDPQMGAGARLPADEGAVGFYWQPHRCALRVRVAQRGWSMVPYYSPFSKLLP